VDSLRIDRDNHAVTVGDETLSHDTPLQLRRELGWALYRHWHSGSGRRPDVRDIRRDHAFEDLLREATPHRTSKTAAVVRSAPLESPVGRHVLFDVGRVRLRIPEAEGNGRKTVVVVMSRSCGPRGCPDNSIFETREAAQWPLLSPKAPCV
jgi:hypothetical protein